MATCKNCGKPLILSGGKCIYCGVAEKQSLHNIQQVYNDTTIDAVDLGLPSMTKWATCNLGAKNPWEYGGYYAWGEIKEKNIYDEKTYRWGTWPTYRKYFNDVFCEVIDNKWVLEPEDDAAHVNWGGSWRMPTLEEYKELICNCHNEWTMMNNVKGLKLVSKNNGKSIFFPAAGYRIDSHLEDEKNYGCYWSGTTSSLRFGQGFGFNDHHGAYLAASHRCLGLSIRPVL